MISYNKTNTLRGRLDKLQNTSSQLIEKMNSQLLEKLTSQGEKIEDPVRRKRVEEATSEILKNWVSTYRCLFSGVEGKERKFGESLQSIFLEEEA